MINLLRKIPKAELHLHIEGTLEPELMFQLAQKNSIEIPYKSVEEVREKYNFNNLQSFLDLYYLGTNVLIQKEDFSNLTFSYLKKVNEDGVRHVEIFFDPQSHTSRGVSFSTVIEGIHEALEEGKKQFGISYFIIMSFLRHLSEEDAFKTLNESLKYKHLIKAVGLDSSEMGFPPNLFERVFKKSQELGFLTVAHAGEEGPAEYIWEALNLLNIKRIDHGVRSEEDPKLLDKIIKEQIPLTVCPLSNVKLKVTPYLKNHNLKKLLDMGVCVTINSDDPSYFGGYLLENYIQCYNELNLNLNDIEKLANNSFQASFLSIEEKNKYKEEIRKIIRN